MKITPRSLSLWLALCLLPGAARLISAQSPKQIPLPKGVERVTSVEGISEYRLPNGLRVLLFPDPSKQTITVNMTYLVGSRHENHGEAGMAHLLEHLMLKGSAGHPEFVKEADARGANWNGTTWLDRTNYYEILPATDANLKWALDLDSDRMVNSFIAQKDLDSEMTVVRNEFEMGESEPRNVLLERLYSTAYLWHRYGNSTIGNRSDIENVSIERLQAFYKTYYQPDNAVLLVAGRFDEGSALEWINQRFAPIPKPARVLPKLHTREPDQDGERTVTLRRAGGVQLAMAGYHIPPGSHPDAAGIQLLAQLLTASSAGRLHQALVETKKASSVFNSTDLHSDPGLLIAGVEARTDASLDAARDALLQAIESVAAESPTKEEVERARNKLLKELELRLNASDKVGLELSEWIGKGDWRLLFLHRDRLRRVTPEEVRQIAVNYLKPSNRTLALFLPTSKPDRAQIPAAADVQAMVKDYKGDPPIEPGEAFDPSPINVHARTTFSSTSGGLKLALLPKKTRGKVVVANLKLRFGDEKSLRDRAMTARMTGLMLLRGAAKRSRRQIQDELDRLRAKLEIAEGISEITASLETKRENLPAAMKLLAEILREPSFPAEEFEQLRQERLALHEKWRTDLDVATNNRIWILLHPYPPGDPRYVASIEERITQLKTLTRDEVKKFHADFFGAQHGELSVVGDFDNKEMAKLADELFGDWQSRLPYSRIAKSYQPIAPANLTIELPDKENALFMAGMNLKLRDDDPDHAALDLANWMLGGAGLSNRLIARIRGKDGLSYGGASWIEWNSFDSVSPFLSAFICAPQNIAKVESAYREEIARALKDGFTMEEFAAGKNGYAEFIRVSLAEDRVWARELGKLSSLNRTPMWRADLEKKIQSLTLEEVNDSLRKHIAPDRLIIIKTGDFAKTKTAKTAN